MTERSRREAGGAWHSRGAAREVLDADRGSLPRDTAQRRLRFWVAPDACGLAMDRPMLRGVPGVRVPSPVPPALLAGVRLGRRDHPPGTAASLRGARA